MKAPLLLATKIWEEHIDVFQHFDLLCVTGSLEDETKSNALFNALVTLNNMPKSKTVDVAIEYLKGSKYYSIENKNSLY